MTTDTYHEETYTHASGKKYNVRWYYDYDMGTPLEWSDCHGVTHRMDWNPTNEEQLEQHLFDNEPELEEETRLRMLKQLSRPSNRYDSGLYYDVMASLHLARTEWGCNDNEACIAAVEADFKYLKSWYDDDWCWLTLSVAPLDADDEIDEDFRVYCGGYESTLLSGGEENLKYRTEMIEDQIHQIEHDIHKTWHPGQLELALA